jgi:DNA-binding CsgD family transcriptional regulator
LDYATAGYEFVNCGSYWFTMTLDGRPLGVTGNCGPRTHHPACGPAYEPEELEASVAAFNDWWHETCRIKQMGENGPVPWRRRRVDERRPVGGRDAATWWSLDRSDRRIAELVALGLTNREIGGQMFRSRRAITSRLRSIFDTLDIRSREELARLAFTLVPESLRELDAPAMAEPERLATITPLRPSARCTSSRRDDAIHH